MSTETINPPPMTRDDLKAFIAEAVQSAICSGVSGGVQSPFRLPEDEHYQHHMHLRRCIEETGERDADHLFVRNLRDGVGVARKASIGAVVTVVIPAFLWLLWQAVKTRP